MLGMLFQHWPYVVLYLASATILSAVALNFQKKQRQKQSPLYSERDLVATLSMTLFFFVVYLLAKLGLGTQSLPSVTSLACHIVGSALVGTGAIINLAGRRALGQFWSDQIEIQYGHRLIIKGAYRRSRHPLYGSLIIFGIGMSLLMQNWLVLSAVLLLFLPAMTHRARREERLLIAAFGGEYQHYQRRCPMLLPRLTGLSLALTIATILALQCITIVGAERSLLGLSALLSVGAAPLSPSTGYRYCFLSLGAVNVICALSGECLPALLYLPPFATIVIFCVGWRWFGSSKRSTSSPVARGNHLRL